MAGRVGAELPVDAETTTFLNGFKTQIEAKSAANGGPATPFTTFTPVSYRTQVVAGINLFATIDVGSGISANVVIWKRLPPLEAELTDVKFTGGAAAAGAGAGAAAEVKETKATHIAGGKSDEKAVDAETTAFVLAQRAAIEAFANKSFAEFVPVSYRTQVVAGKNYFVTIRVATAAVIHVKIWQKVAPPSVVVTEVENASNAGTTPAAAAESPAEAKETKTTGTIVGAKSDEKAIDDETKAFVITQKAAIEAVANKTFTTFEPISFKQQVVSGLNLFVTINVGGGRFLHVTIWKRVGGAGNEVTAVTESGAGEEKAETKATGTLVGAKSDEKAIDDETKAFVLSQKTAIEAVANKTFTTFDPISFKQQVVSGINLFVTISIGGGRFLHVTIWKRVGGAGNQVTAVTES